MTNPYVFTPSSDAETPEPHELWLELERSYALRARLLNVSSRLDGISQSLLNDTIFELQEIEYRFTNAVELEVDASDAVPRVRALNDALQVWLERLGDDPELESL
ncbi:MAG: hypothetical protein HC933_12940 [Pleurocapsa sp. SU_196_0]|nr:hypothetical protein [Pleurocapsa sp. SU_196_0]